MADVDENEEQEEFLGMVQIVADNILQFLAFLVRKFGETIARKIHQIPAIVYEEMVHEPGLAGSSGSHGKLSVSGKHVYQGRFADVRSPDERYFRQSLGRFLRDHRAAAGKLSAGDFGARFHLFRKSEI